MLQILFGFLAPKTEPDDQCAVVWRLKKTAKKDNLEQNEKCGLDVINHKNQAVLVSRKISSSERDHWPRLRHGSSTATNDFGRAGKPENCWLSAVEAKVIH